MGEAFTRHSLRPLDFLRARRLQHSGVIRREAAKPYLLLFEP